MGGFYRRDSMWAFVGLNVCVWAVMTAILVVLPDALDKYVDIGIARAFGWAVAGGIWMVAIERQWRARMGALARFPFQVVLWVSSALAATWISDQFRP